MYSILFTRIFIKKYMKIFNENTELAVLDISSSCSIQTVAIARLKFSILFYFLCVSHGETFIRKYNISIPQKGHHERLNIFLRAAVLQNSNKDTWINFSSSCISDCNWTNSIHTSDNWEWKKYFVWLLEITRNFTLTPNQKKKKKVRLFIQVEIIRIIKSLFNYSMFGYYSAVLDTPVSRERNRTVFADVRA